MNVHITPASEADGPSILQLLRDSGLPIRRRTGRRACGARGDGPPGSPEFLTALIDSPVLRQRLASGI